MVTPGASGSSSRKTDQPSSNDSEVLLHSVHANMTRFSRRGQAPSTGRSAKKRRGSAAARGDFAVVQQPVLARPAAGAGAVADLELAIDVREVELDRLICHPQLLRHLAVREPVRYESEDLQLARGEERRRRAVRRRPARP